MPLSHNILQEPISEWGGPWTEKKLNAFTKYVSAYLTIMNRYPYWKTIYFDGFAGSGNRKEQPKSDLYQQLKITPQEDHVYKGSAERVLKLMNNHSFDFYYFIDTNETSLNKLEIKLKNLSGVTCRQTKFQIWRLQPLDSRTFKSVKIKKVCCPCTS